MRHDCPQWVDGRQLMDQYPNKAMLVQRTFSKSFGLAACRVGYAFGSAGLVARLQQAALPYAVDAFSLLAARIAFTAPTTVAWRKQTAQQNHTLKQQVINTLTHLGIGFVPSYTNFIYLHTAHLHPDSKVLFNYLVEQHGVIVRPAGPGSLRISIGNTADTHKLIQALTAMANQFALALPNT
jgi:histidinol-phosphate aminotransferase